MSERAPAQEEEENEGQLQEEEHISCFAETHFTVGEVSAEGSEHDRDLNEDIADGGDCVTDGTNEVAMVLFKVDDHLWKEGDKDEGVRHTFEPNPEYN